VTKQELSKILKKPLVVLDTETTGFLYAAGDEVIELAGEKIVNGEVIDTFHKLICPTRPVPASAIAVHGLTNEYLAQFGDAPGRVFSEFSDFIQGTVLVGHNIRRFDYPFIANHFFNEGLPNLTNEIIDTLELSRLYLSIPNHKLGTIATHFGISTEGAHRAMADVVMTRQILFKLLDA
jgi:DNA polymerase III epsilon subunit family exonuclease